MAMMFAEKTISLGHSLVKRELELNQKHLQERKSDLLKAREVVRDLEDTCQRLSEKVADLERDLTTIAAQRAASPH